MKSAVLYLQNVAVDFFLFYFLLIVISFDIYCCLILFQEKNYWEEALSCSVQKMNTLKSERTLKKWVLLTRALVTFYIGLEIPRTWFQCYKGQLIFFLFFFISISHTERIINYYFLSCSISEQSKAKPLLFVFWRHAL